MKPFRFRLGRLQQLRGQELDAERARHESACAVCDAANQAMRDRAARKAAHAEAAERRLAEGRTAPELRGDAGQREADAAQLAQAQGQVEHASEEREKQRTRMLDAWRRVRLLERLETRAKARHDRDAARVAQRELDETGQLRWWERSR